MRERNGNGIGDLGAHFAQWEKTKDCVDQFIDLMLNYRQSGHPGGSRSKVHLLLAAMLGRDHALGHPASREAFRRPIRPRRGPSSTRSWRS